MRKYILEIEGDFEKGDCEKCPISYTNRMRVFKGAKIRNTPNPMCDEMLDCPLEEAKPIEYIGMGTWTKGK